MSQAHSGTESSIDSSTTSGASAPSVEPGRFARAVTEDIDEFDVWNRVVAPDRGRDREQNRTSVEGALTASTGVGQ